MINNNDRIEPNDPVIKTERRISEISGLYLSEAMKIRDVLFPGLSLEYLFSQSDNAN